MPKGNMCIMSRGSGKNKMTVDMCEILAVYSCQSVGSIVHYSLEDNLSG